MAKNKDQTDLFSGHQAVIRALETYNPWWHGKPLPETPHFTRDVFEFALKHINAPHSLALLINGPRRVGKTTVMRQLIRYLINERKIAPTQILFFSMDDPLVQQLPPERRGEGFELLLQAWEEKLGSSLRDLKAPAYCLLDEVQRLPHWELYIKRYVDLRYPVRFTISGSASHTIFRRSLESLLGRLVEVSLPPFSFREWLRLKQPAYALAASPDSIGQVDMKDKQGVIDSARRIINACPSADPRQLNVLADEYAQAGGFPQLWDIVDPVERSQFIDDQFVRRVTLEDLRLVKEIRRPDIFHQFLRYAFARTGAEYNLEDLARQIKTTRATLADALPLLLQTELIRKVERFANKAVRLRSTHARLYAADTSLYEAVTKLPARLDGDDKGRLAETLVFNALWRLAGITEISYFRTPSGKREVDFILRIGKNYVPVEVKSGNVQTRDGDSVRHFLSEYGSERDYGIIVGGDELSESGPIVNIPFGVFLMLG